MENNQREYTDNSMLSVVGSHLWPVWINFINRDSFISYSLFWTLASRGFNETPSSPFIVLLQYLTAQWNQSAVSHSGYGTDYTHVVYQQRPQLMENMLMNTVHIYCMSHIL